MSFLLALLPAPVGSAPASTVSETSGFSALYNFPILCFSSLYFSQGSLCSNPTRVFSNAIELLVPLPLRQPLMGFDGNLRSQTQNLVF